MIFPILYSVLRVDLEDGEGVAFLVRSNEQRLAGGRVFGGDDSSRFGGDVLLVRIRVRLKKQNQNTRWCGIFVCGLC